MAVPSQDPSHGRPRVLVIFPGALGDLICLIPALRALGPRHRGASIDLMAREELARFSVGRMGIRQGYSIERREVSHLFGESAHLRDDARRFFGVFQRIYSFFASENRRFRDSMTLVTDGRASFHPFRPDGAGHVAAAYLRALGEPAEVLQCRLDVLPQDLDAAARRLESVGLDGNFALLIPGSGSITKNWPAQRFAELAKHLKSRTPVAIVIGPAETHLEQFFVARRLTVLKDMELGQLAGIAAVASLFVGNDSGVSHLVAAVGLPGVALFGPSDPQRWRPLGRVKVLQGSPLEELEAAEVADTAIEMLCRSNQP